MSDFISRQIAAIIQKQKSKFPILAITGPRQSGKTTLIRNLFNDYKYLSLENPDTREFATSDPVGFLNKYDQKIILDEVQKVPALFSYIQGRVDESQMMGQYILSGSQNFHLLNNITQSLAGRVALFKLLPFDFLELKVENALEGQFVDVALKGFYPAIYVREINPIVFYSNYIQTYLEKDVTELLNIKDLKLFRVFISLCAGRAGQLLNISGLASDCGVSINTAKAWLSILESSYVIFLLQPYYQNFNKRIIKSPKLYFYDTGLLNFLLGIRSSNDLENDNKIKGHVFENMIIAEYYKQNYHQYLHREYFFWQDSNAHEIDLLYKNGNDLSVFEIKSGQTVSSAYFKELDRFEEISSPARINKNLIYGGTENEKRTNYNVLSWKNISDKY